MASIWARVREAYEAELLRGIARRHLPRAHRMHRVPAGPEGFDVVRVDPATGARETLLRGPRPLPLGSLWLRPEFVQFGLPVSVASAAIWTVRLLVAGASPLFLAPGVAQLVGGLVWYTLIGRWLFAPRWRRLREEADDRWRWRFVAATEEAERANLVGGAPRRLVPDE